VSLRRVQVLLGVLPVLPLFVEDDQQAIAALRRTIPTFIP